VNYPDLKSHQHERFYFVIHLSTHFNLSYHSVIVEQQEQIVSPSTPCGNIPLIYHLRLAPCVFEALRTYDDWL